MLEQDVDQVLITEQQLDERIKEMGHQIAEDYQGEPLTIVGILKGAVIFLRIWHGPLICPCRWISCLSQAMEVERLPAG